MIGSVLKVSQIMEDHNMMTLKDQTLNKVVQPLKVQTLIIVFQPPLIAQTLKDKGISDPYFVPKEDYFCQSARFLDRVN